MRLSVRGAIALTNRPIHVGGLTVGGRKARLILRVKTGSRRHRHEFDHFCRRHGLDAVRLEHVDDSPDGWGHTNTKLARSNQSALIHSYLTWGLSLAPADESGYQ